MTSKLPLMKFTGSRPPDSQGWWPTSSLVDLQQPEWAQRRGMFWDESQRSQSSHLGQVPLMQRPWPCNTRPTPDKMARGHTCNTHAHMHLHATGMTMPQSLPTGSVPDCVPSGASWLTWVIIYIQASWGHAEYLELNIVHMLCPPTSLISFIFYLRFWRINILLALELKICSLTLKCLILGIH